MSTFFPIIHSADLGRSLRFYRDELAFVEKYRFPGDGPPEFLYLEREGAGLGLGRPTSDDHGLAVRVGLPATFSRCVYVAGQDDLYARVVARGAAGLRPPADEPWGSESPGCRTRTATRSCSSRRRRRRADARADPSVAHQMSPSALQ